MPREFMKEHPDGVFVATATQGGWCACGCGHFKIALVDDDGLMRASFGYDQAGWLRWLKSTRAAIEAGEPPEFFS